MRKLGLALGLSMTALVVACGGGGGSGFISGTYSPPGPTIPSPAPPPHDVANVGISIIVAGKTYDAGDQYGCCTGTSDGYM